jgi:hypothetical protein
MQAGEGAGEGESFRWWLGGRAGDLASTSAARRCFERRQESRAHGDEIKRSPGAIATLKLRYKLQK